MSYSHGTLVDLRVVSKYVFDAVVNCSALGPNTIVVNETTKHIAVLQYVLDCATPGNTITWEDSDGILHSGPMPFSETGGMVAPFSEVGHFVLAAGKSLVLDLAAAAQVSGHLSYALV
jgi:hypothetical protein